MGDNGFDGTIRINTSVDAKGMTKGTKSINNSLAGVLQAVRRIGIAIGLAFTGAFILNFVRDITSSFDLMGSSVGGNIKAITTAFDGLKAAAAQVIVQFLIALTPVIITVITWLTNLLNILAAIIHVLFNVGEGMGAVATETKAAGKAAKGALAPFDQLNVLQKSDKGTGADAGKPVLSALTIPDSILEKVKEFKEKFLAFIAPIAEAFTRLKDTIITTLAPLWDWLNLHIVQPFKKWFGEELTKAVDWFVKKLNELTKWITENPDKFRNIVLSIGLLIVAIVAIIVIVNIAIVVFTALWSLFEIIAGVVLVVIGVFTFLASPIGLVILAIIALIAILLVLIFRWNDVKEVIKKVWLEIQLIMLIWVSKQLEHANSFKNAFGAALDFIKTKFENVFNGLKSFLKGVVNGMIDLINGMIAGIAGGINGIVGTVNSIGSNLPGFVELSQVNAVKIPHLATGAVIPPNAQFAAILGDQRSGTNIETPENLLRQIMREEQGKIQADINITFTGSLSELVRLLKPQIDKENIRIGASLVKGKVAVS